MADQDYAAVIIEQFLSSKSEDLFVSFLRQYLLVCNTASRRWQVQGVVSSLFRIANDSQKVRLLKILWESIWPEVRNHGKRAAQLVDLLGYFTVKHVSLLPKELVLKYWSDLFDLLKTQNGFLAGHPNCSIYNLSSVLDFDGYYLELNPPCLVCNNPEIPLSNLKLSSIKADSRFSTTAHIIKLTGSYEISRISLRISELKRSKMVRRINLYYSNKTVLSVVDLKNKPEIWSKPRKFTLTQGQTDLRMDFPLPIVACNLMIEYAEFFESHAATTESLQCPRCSATVPATPGVCGNCGENVYQCHKCRSINYDEKDPFLCNACGFCKYGKFEYSVFGRSCFSVEPITNEDERKKSVSSIANLLEKAENIHLQLQQLRPQIEGVLCHLFGAELSGHRTEDTTDPLMTSLAQTQAPPPTIVTATGSSSLSAVSRPVQQLSRLYSRECKAAFDELSKTLQKILAYRAELLRYDRNESCDSTTPQSSTDQLTSRTAEGCCRCYGCLVASIEHLLLLLRAFITVPEIKGLLQPYSKLLVRELFEVNLRNGPTNMRRQTTELLCTLATDSEESTLINQLVETNILKSFGSLSDRRKSIAPELCLLSVVIKRFDANWEPRVKCVLRLFIKSLSVTNGDIWEAVSLPCLKVLESLIVLSSPISESKTGFRSPTSPGSFFVNISDWLDPNACTELFPWWRSDNNKFANTKLSKADIRAHYLVEKFGHRWLSKTTSLKHRVIPKFLEVQKDNKDSWIVKGLFCPHSAHTRQSVVSILKASAANSPYTKASLLDLLTQQLMSLGDNSDIASEFVNLFKNLIEEDIWKHYLSHKGLLKDVGALINKEISLLNERENQLSTDLSQGFAVKVFAELLGSFFTVDAIRQKWKSSVLNSVLNAYLALRRLLVQRTKHTDDAQAALLKLLEQLTSGTEKDSRDFMQACVSTLKNLPDNDIRTPIFIFERVCSIIFPEEKEIDEFLINIEKDTAQEEFLQGRMMGNPYNSQDPGMGPLMRDIKNKICRDCDLVALLDDDTGMEVITKNIAAEVSCTVEDLPVSEVYRKVWERTHPGEAMLVVYRMRGLLGDATEEFIRTLDSRKDGKIDEEQEYRMAGVFGDCGGQEVLLHRLRNITNTTQCTALTSVLLKTFEYCMKIRKNRQRLIDPKMKTVAVLLTALQKTLSGRPEFFAVSEKLLLMIESVLVEANKLPSVKYHEFSNSFGDNSFLPWMFSLIQDNRVMSNTNLKAALLRVLPNSTLANEERMEMLVQHLKPCIDFNRFDAINDSSSQNEMDSMCVMVQQILAGNYGSLLKDKLVKANFVREAADYLTGHCPLLFDIGPSSDPSSNDWKIFLSKPSLKYILRMLTGLCISHERSQNLIAESYNCIMIVHRLEQISTEEHLGSLSEKLMEALKENPKVANKIEEVRTETKKKKKDLAKRMRDKQLADMGMKVYNVDRIEVNEKGQVRVNRAPMKNIDQFSDDVGLMCCVCGDGYKSQPQKVLAIYTYTKRVNADDFENKMPKKVAYSTVSHFNVIHVDCHNSAVRTAPSREEWESAKLHNAHTLCNGLLPLYGPSIPESSFTQCLLRHNNYIQELTGVETTFLTSVHDVKHLLWLFASQKSFSEACGGGGKESNGHLIPYLLFLSLHGLQNLKTHAAEERTLRNFLDLPVQRMAESAFEAEGALYYVTLSLLLFPGSEWQSKRVAFLKQLLASAYYRLTFGSQSSTKFASKLSAEFSLFKPYLNMYAIVDGIYKRMFKEVTGASVEEWSKNLYAYIRRNDVALQKDSIALNEFFDTVLRENNSFEQFCNVVGLDEFPLPQTFLDDLSSSIETTGP